MTALLAFAEAHPWWTLVYLLIGVAAVVACVAHVSTAVGNRAAASAIKSALERLVSK